MEYSVVIVISGGVGDQIEGLKCAHHIPKTKKVKILSCSRNEVFAPLKHLFGNQFEIEQIPESYAENYRLLFDQSLMKTLKGDADEIYFSCPDTLYSGPYAFNYKKYDVSLPVLKSTRLLLNKYEPQHEIYLGLMSTTPGYLYKEIVYLAKRLADNLPEYLIHLPILPKWANQDICIPDVPVENPPANLICYYDPDFIEQLELQRRCCYGIYTDNGCSHTSFHFGQPRIVLDPRFEKSMWISRWKENPGDCIDINTSVIDIIRLVVTNLKIPQTQLLPHKYVLDIIRRDAMLRQETNWGYELGIKFS